MAADSPIVLLSLGKSILRDAAELSIPLSPTRDQGETEQHKNTQYHHKALCYMCLCI